MNPFIFSQSADPQWIPSDAEMLSWIEKKRAVVSIHGYDPEEWKVFALRLSDGVCLNAIEEIAPTLREAIEKAMKIFP